MTVKGYTWEKTWVPTFSAKMIILTIYTILWPRVKFSLFFRAYLYDKDAGGGGGVGGGGVENKCIRNKIKISQTAGGTYTEFLGVFIMNFRFAI